jgi:hypothetical protein
MIDMTEYKYYETANYYLIYSELIQAARRGGTLTYQEIANLVGLPLRGSHMAAEIGHLIGAISANEVKCGRPMLSATAVGVSGEPGGGFYKLAEGIGLLQEGDDYEKFWQDQKQTVYRTWQRSFAAK